MYTKILKTLRCSLCAVLSCWTVCSTVLFRSPGINSSWYGTRPVWYDGAADFHSGEQRLTQTLWLLHWEGIFSPMIWAISVCDLYTVCNYCSHNLFVQWPHYSWTESEFSRVSIIICSNLVFVKCVWRYLCRVTNYTGHISITYVAIPDRNCVFCMFNVLYPLIVRFIHTS